MKLDSKKLWYTMQFSLISRVLPFQIGSLLITCVPHFFFFLSYISTSNTILALSCSSLFLFSLILLACHCTL
ncbi:hypothetical protein C2G38_1340893 [Gigaspora rosea]|uniref:Uncharacterized protein n=1 Tax=Gigaspora rosea TaxID=44941 RepID=A0A397V7W4_9GLOM|nr:hypothetical protein C2G38_1340893 [Gigaspora rosea]